MKAFLRWMVVATSFPPFTLLYRALYSALIGLAVRRLRGLPGFKAIYLRRGLATGECVYGISDIDLAVIGDWDETRQELVATRYRRLARLCPIYDPTIGVYAPRTLGRLLETDAFHRHRLVEGQKTWRLLAGEDCLAGLPPVPAHKAAAGYEAEVKLWWTYYVRWAFAPAARRPDPIFDRSLCYKAVAEVARMAAALCGRPLPPARRAAVDFAIEERGEPASAFLRKLQQSAAGRHLRYRGDIWQDTLDFLLPHLEGIFRRLHNDSGQRVPVQLDAPPTERLYDDGVEVLVEGLTRAVKGRLGGLCQATHLVSSLAFAMDEVVLVIETSRGERPKVSTLRAVADAIRAVSNPTPRRVSVYLLLEEAAYQLYASDYFRGWQAVLAPHANPDVFAAIGRHDGAGSFAMEESCELEWQLLSEALASPATYKANNLDFARAFWKFLELSLVRQSLRGGSALCAQTPAAVGRGLRRLGLPAPPFLEPFDLAYRSELRGNRADIGRLIPAAVAYLNQLIHEA